jgi:outer membrane protein
MTNLLRRNAGLGLPVCLLLSLACLQAQQQTMHLTLAEAEKLAIQNNPRFTAARLNAAALYQVPTELHAAYEPMFFGSLTGVGADGGSRLAAGALNNPVVYNRLGSGLSVSQLITDFGRTGNLMASAKLRAQAEDQVTETTRADILLAVSRAYYSVLRAQAILQVADQTVKARQLIVDQVSALAASKLKSQLDVSFANVNLGEAKLLLAGAQNDINATQAQLAEAMGLPGQTAFALDEEPMPEPMPDQIQPLLQAALRNRPELANLRLTESAAQRFVQAEHSLYYPSIGVVGTAGFVPSGQAQIPGRYGAVGVNVSIPIFNGGLYKARQTEAELRARAAGQNITAEENRVARDVRVAYLNALTANDRLSLTQQLLDQAKLALDLSQKRYELGLSSIVELSQAQLNLTSAQIEAARAKYDYQSLRAMLQYQTGDLR